MERGTVEWWNGGILEWWNERLTTLYRFYSASWACALAIDIEKQIPGYLLQVTQARRQGGCRGVHVHPLFSA